MQIGVTLTQLLADLRSEIGFSSKVNVGVDAYDAHTTVLRRMQQTLYDEHKWPHLRVVSSVPLAAGQRFYDPPSDIGLDRIDRVVARDSTTRLWPVERGIGFEHYNARSEDEREDPVRAWELRWTGAAVQVEAWPTPATDEYVLWLEGTRKLGPLVDGDDVCSIDSVAIVLFSAAELLARQEAQDAQNKLALANRRLRFIKANLAGPERMSTFGGSRGGLPRGVQVISSIRG